MNIMTHGFRCLLAATVLLVLTGCASTMMTKTGVITSPPQGKAIVTFVRPSMFGGAIQFGIWDSDKFVGILSAKSLVQYAAVPGEHIFMARAENWSYLKANLEAGKEYYVIGKVFPGVWKARAALVPVRKADLAKPGELEKVATWLRELTPTTPMESKIEDYANPRLTQVREGIEEFKKGKVNFSVLEAGDGQ